MSGHTALLVVHGVGAQEPGRTLDKLVRGLRLADREFEPEPQGNGLAGTLAGRPVRLYEVYWADLLKGEATRGAFQMNEAQSLAWFPWFNSRRGNYRRGSYSLLKVAWWCVALPLFNFFLLFAYHGATFLVRIAAGAFHRKEWAEGDGGASVTILDRLLDEYAGDVFTYVNSAGQAFHREKDEPAVLEKAQAAFADVLQRFHQQLLAADAEGCATIQVVAHSLGSVVAYHALSGFEAGAAGATEAVRAALSKVSRLYTIGSPLEKIRFFWPRIAPLDRPASSRKLRWDNFVSFFDPVSGMLRSFDDWGEVKNHRLLGGGFILGHLVYEHSPVFLGYLTEGLSGRRLAFARSLRARLKGSLVLAGETLAAPFGLALILIVGAALFILTAALLPLVSSLLLRWFVAEGTLRPLKDAATVVFTGMMVLAFLVGPLVRASKVHEDHWAPTGRRKGSDREAA